MIPNLTAERRRAPRFPVRLRVKTSGLTLYTTNISHSGTQILCPELMMTVIHAPLEKKRLDLILHFPDGTSADLQCAVVYVSDVGGEYAIGLHYMDFRASTLEPLSNYLREYAGSGFVLGAD